MEAKAIPLVTVLIDTYNHERFIERAINSVLDQDMPMDGVEILVVDDGSTDRTPDIVRRFEPRVRLIRKPNGGQASAFNFGFAQAPRRDSRHLGRRRLVGQGKASPRAGDA